MVMSVELPQISYVAPNFADNFVDSLRQYGFAAVVDHPLDSHRIERIYRDWLAFFASEEVSDFTMDPQRQDGYFSLQSAEHAKGFGTGTLKNIFSFIVGDAVPAHSVRILRRTLMRRWCWAPHYLATSHTVCLRQSARS